MPLIAIGDLRTFHSSLSSHLWLQKIEKYILVALLSIIISQIPFKVVGNDVKCVVNKYQLPEDKAWNNTVFSNFLCWAYGIKCSESGASSTQVLPIQYVANSGNFLQSDILKENTDSESCPALGKISGQLIGQYVDYVTVKNVDSRNLTCGIRRKKINSRALKDQVRNAQLLRSCICENNLSSSTSSSSPEHKSEEELIDRVDCEGQRAKYMAFWFGVTVLIIIAVFVGHDTWLEMSKREINEMKKFGKTKAELGVCDDCAESVLQRNLDKDLCCASTPSRRRLNIQEIRKDQLLHNPPKTLDMDTKYKLQNIVVAILLVIVLYIFWATVEHNYNGHRCPGHNSSYHMVCHDKNKHIVSATSYIVSPLIVFLLATTLIKCWLGTPYLELLTALSKDG